MRILFAATVLIVLVLIHSSASAQSRDDARARRLFEDAMSAMDDGSYDLAIERLTESLALAPRPATAFNLGLALRGAGRIREAIARLDALLAARAELRPEQRREAEQLRSDAIADLATLRVRVTGARELELRIDGSRVDGVAPGTWTEQRVDPGDHVITASARDHGTLERSITVPRGGSSELEIELVPVADTRPGILVLESTDPSLMVEIDGIASAMGSLRRELPPGEYVVRVISESARRDSRIEVPAGRMVRLSLEPPVGSRSIVEEPWLWLTLGAIVLVGGGIGVGVGVAVDSQRAPPITDPVFPVIETLTW